MIKAKLSYWVSYLGGKWRLLWGFCPHCNSDAPYGCHVCRGYQRDIWPPDIATKQRWWRRYITVLELQFLRKRSKNPKSQTSEISTKEN